jgi:hypothetical protein
MVGAGLSPSLRGAEGLSGLPDDLLVGVPDALSLVRLGRPDLPDLGGELPHELLVVRPWGMGRFTGWQNPIWRTSFFPSTFALYPTPSISSFLSKPCETPFSMFAMRALAVPW